MRPLDQTVDSLSETDSSALIMETIPRITHYLRSEIRRHRGPGFSIPQFRTLFFLSRNQGASLSDVAAHIGLTLPSTSKLVDGLVERNMVVRETSLLDRRCLTLSLTPNGRRALASAHRAAHARLKEVLSTLSADERQTIAEAMLSLARVFGGLPRENNARVR